MSQAEFLHNMQRAFWQPGICDDPLKMLELLPLPLTDRKRILFACACIRQVWHLLERPESRPAILAQEWLADGHEETVDMSVILTRGSGANIYYCQHHHEEGFHLAHQAAWNATDAVCVLCDTVGPVLDDGRLGQILSSLWSAEHAPLGTHPGERGTAPSYACDLVREIVGDPFEPVRLPGGRVACYKCGCGTVYGDTPEGRTEQSFYCKSCFAKQPWNPDWLKSPYLTEQVLSLAQAAYEWRLEDGRLDPVRLAILADCLEEAGYPPQGEEPHLLEHLRGQRRRASLASGSLDGWGLEDIPVGHYRGCWAVDLLLGNKTWQKA